MVKAFARDLLVTVEINRLEEMSDLDFFEIRREIKMLIASVKGRVLADPLDFRNVDQIIAAFEIDNRFQKIVEDNLIEGMRIPSDLKGTVAFNEIPPLNDPASGVVID